MSTEHEQDLRQQRSEEVVLRAIGDVNQLRPVTDVIPVGLTTVFRGEDNALHNVTVMSIVDNKSSAVRQKTGLEVSK